MFAEYIAFSKHISKNYDLFKYSLLSSRSYACLYENLSIWKLKSCKSIEQLHILCVALLFKYKQTRKSVKSSAILDKEGFSFNSINF
jgi:hypothetical protein